MDMPAVVAICPLLGAERKSDLGVLRAAFDPKLTNAFIAIPIYQLASNDL
jgi:hypothetical protein